MRLLERIARLWPGECEARLEHLEILIEQGRIEEAAEAHRAIRQRCRNRKLRRKAREMALENPDFGRG